MADNRIAYGLAKKYGIDTKGMSPKEVWDALREHGVTQQNAQEKYSSDGNGGMHEPTEAESKRLKELGVENSWENGLEPRGQVDITPGITKESYVSRELGVDKETANRYVSAIDAYADERYSDIRAYQRGEKVNDQQEIAGIAEDIEEYIKKAPRWNGGETYRGIGLSDDDLSKYTLGSVHDMGGVSSWSSKEEIARQFADHYHGEEVGIDNAVILHSKTQNKGTAIRHLSKYPGEKGENEVIASKESRYKVIDKKMDGDGRTHIYMEEV